MPVTDEVALDDRAMTGHLRHCLMTPEKMPVILCVRSKVKISRSHVLSLSGTKGEISQSVHKHNRSRDLAARMARRCGARAVLKPQKIAR